MPVFELSGTRRGRWRAFSRAQLPLLGAAAFVTVEGVLALPHVVTSLAAVGGIGLIVGASALFLLLPWERWPTSALIGLAILDVIGVAYVRLAYFADIPSVGLLAVFPVVWLAYAFSRWIILLAISGALFIALLPVLVDGAVPHTALEVARVVTLPVIVTGLAIVVGEAARQLAGSQRRAREANRQLRSSLRVAEDSQALTRILFETVDVAMAFYDTERHLVMANNQAVQAVAAAGFRLDQEPFAGAEVRRANKVDVIPFADQVIPRALRGDLVNHEMEWIGVPGQQIAIVAYASDVELADGSKWGTLVAVHNVTDLARSLQVKDEFIATVSHELRTPLTSIIGYLEVVTEELDGAEPFVVDSLATISRNAQKLQDRIQELLTTADEQNNLDVKRNDLTTVIRRAIEAQSRQAAIAGVSLGTDVTESLWGEFDAGRIEQVIDNLLTNAIKYSPDGDVVVRAYRTDAALIVQVTDNGVGMNPDETAQAFDMFWRADQARQGAIQGIGIGLSLARRLVEAHHGHINLDSERGKGTTFTVTLPQKR